MSVDMTKSYAFTFCDTDGGTTIAVEKSRYAAESFNAELETEYRARIGLDAWGDNNAWGNNKVDNKVDNNARSDNKADNNVGDDTVNETVKRPQTRTRTTTPYNTRTRPVQHPYKKRRCCLGRVGFFHGPISGPLNGPISGQLNGALNGPLNCPLKDKVMNLIAEIPGVNRKELVCRTGVSERTMTRNLSELERFGKIEHRSSKKTGGYFLAEGLSGC